MPTDAAVAPGMGFHVYRSWLYCNLSLASPELGAQEGPSLPPSTIHYGTDFNISLSEV